MLVSLSSFNRVVALTTAGIPQTIGFKLYNITTKPRKNFMQWYSHINKHIDMFDR